MLKFTRTVYLLNDALRITVESFIFLDIAFCGFLVEAIQLTYHIHKSFAYDNEFSVVPLCTSVLYRRTKG